MRGLAAHRDDAGVATIFVVTALPVLVLFAALVLDGGRAYIARRETQNSADAAALAMATDCAMGLPSCVSGADTTAGNYKRSTTQRSSITDETVVASDTYCDKDKGFCKATMQQSIGFIFAPGGGAVTRSGIARWGGIRAASVPSPITIAACEWDADMLPATADVEFFLDDPQKKIGCSSPTGGFSLLRATRDAQRDECITKPVQDASGDWTIAGRPGTPQRQIADCLDKILDKPNAADRTLLIPLYNDGLCGGRCSGNGDYPIEGYAMVLLKGYRLHPPTQLTRLPAGPPPAPSTDWCMKDMDVPADGVEDNSECIIGDFVERILPGNLPGVVSGGSNFGATRPYLVYSESSP